MNQDPKETGANDYTFNEWFVETPPTNEEGNEDNSNEH
jgi:hypothetical protein